MEGLAKKLKLKTTVAYRNWFHNKQVDIPIKIEGEIYFFLLKN